ncbi:hypothetical protein BC567DRAFT_227291 [Phyllosticta citribraziliensis]
MPTAMADDLEELLLETLDDLEWRLRRIEFVLGGSLSLQDADAPVTTRLQKLESSLANLASKSRAVKDVLQLQSKHGDIFAPTARPSELISSRDRNVEPTPEIKLATVLTEAPAFPATASQLTSLQDLPLPPTGSFTSLVGLSPRITELEQRQLSQAREISELRQRSGRAVLRWHEVMVLGQGRCWAEWDQRVRQAERDVRRKEVKMEQESG